MALRIAFFTSARPGGVAHTVLVRDIPGLDYGTLPNRLEDTALRFLPRFIKRRLVVGGGPLMCLPTSSLSGTETLLWLSLSSAKPAPFEGRMLACQWWLCLTVLASPLACTAAYNHSVSH